MTERNERDAHSVVIRELEPSWKTAPKRATAKPKRRSGLVLLVIAMLFVLVVASWAAQIFKG